MSLQVQLDTRDVVRKLHVEGRQEVVVVVEVDKL